MGSSLNRSPLRMCAGRFVAADHRSHPSYGYGSSAPKPPQIEAFAPPLDEESQADLRKHTAALSALADLARISPISSCYMANNA
jgi:hypothetical protein